MAIYIENSKELTDKLLELKSNFKKAAGKKKRRLPNIQISCTSLYWQQTGIKISKVSST